MSIKIIVLDDGETWSGAGQVLTITDDAYNRLCEGAEIKDLEENDILDFKEVDTDV